MTTEDRRATIERFAAQYVEDCRRPDAPADEEERLNSWLWFTCPAHLRREVRREIERTGSQAALCSDA